MRRGKDDLRDELPPKRREPLIFQDFDAAESEHALAEQMLKDRALDSAAAPSVTDETDFGRMVRELGGTSEQVERLHRLGFSGLSELRRLTASAKVPLAVRVINEILSGDDGKDRAAATAATGTRARPRQPKVVVFAHHVEVINALVDAFPDGQSVCIFGETSQDDRLAAVERFQHDESCRVFIGSIRASGQGITLTAASRVLFVELDWSPMVLSQAEDRCHRIGQDEEVLVQYLTIKGTLDERLGHVLKRKQEQMQPLYKSISLAQPSAKERQPRALLGQISELRARRREAQKMSAEARQQRDAQLARLAADEREEAEQLEEEGRRARLALEEKIQESARRARERLEVELSKRRSEIENRLREMERRQDEIVHAAKLAEEEVSKELERSEWAYARMQAAKARDEEGASVVTAPPPSSVLTDDRFVEAPVAADDLSHDEDFGESGMPDEGSDKQQMKT